MPVRDKAVNHIASLVTGISLAEMSRPPRRNATTVVRMSADRVYEEVVLAIDWNRVYLDATARHLSLHKKDAEPLGGPLVAPSDEALAAAAEREDEDRPFAPPPAWMTYRHEDICPECLMEAVLANEWGGKQADKWAANPVSTRWRFPIGGKRHPDHTSIVRELIGYAWQRPEPAEPTELDHDGHMPTCVESGTPRDGIVWVCDPRCPEYDGWAEETANDMAFP